MPGVAAAETEHSPLTESMDLTLLGFGALAAGAFGVWGGVTMGRAHGWRRAEDAPLRGELGRGLGRVLVALVAGAVAAYLLIVVLDVYHPAALLAMPGAALPAWGLPGLRRRRRR